jgi:hypothetical protein
VKKEEGSACADMDKYIIQNVIVIRNIIIKFLSSKTVTSCSFLFLIDDTRVCPGTTCTPVLSNMLLRLEPVTDLASVARVASRNFNVLVPSSIQVLCCLTFQLPEAASTEVTVVELKKPHLQVGGKLKNSWLRSIAVWIKIPFLTSRSCPEDPSS